MERKRTQSPPLSGKTQNFKNQNPAKFLGRAIPADVSTTSYRFYRSIIPGTCNSDTYLHTKYWNLDIR